MSTRATYKFKDTHAPTITFYVHHDSYASGAAEKFCVALSHPLPGTLAAKFFRANECAEFACDHNHHRDTEYRYTVTGNGPKASLTVCKRSGWSPPVTWDCTFSGLLTEFIGRHNTATNTA